MLKAVLLACALLLPALSQAQVKLLRHPTYSKGKVAFSYLGDIWIANEDGSEPSAPHRQRGARDLPALLARRQLDRVFLQPRRQLRRLRGARHRRQAAPAHLPHRRRQRGRLDARRQEDPLLLRPRQWRLPHRGHAFRSPAWTAASSSPSPPTGAPAPATRRTARSWPSAPPLRLVAPALPRRLCRRPLGAWISPRKTYTPPACGDADYKGNSLWPMYGADGDIYFVADSTANEKTIKYGGPEVMKSVNNIWKISEKGGTPVQVTHHGDGNLFFPSISADRKTIVYEDNFGLWKLDTASGKSSEIRIDIKSDSKENDTELVTITNEAEAFHLSPSNRRAAIVVHGEIFTIATGTRRAAARHRNALARAGRALVARRQVDRVRLRPHRPAGGLDLRRTRQERQKAERRRLRQDRHRLGARFQIAAVERHATTSCGAWMSTPARRRGGDSNHGGNIGDAAVLAGRQVDLLLQAGQAAAHPRLRQEPGDGRGAHDHLRPVPDVAPAPSGRRTARSCCSSAA